MAVRACDAERLPNQCLTFATLGWRQMQELFIFGLHLGKRQLIFSRAARKPSLVPPRCHVRMAQITESDQIAQIIDPASGARLVIRQLVWRS